MADASLGVLGKMGISTVANWDSSWPGATTVYPFISENLTHRFSRKDNDQLVGYGGMLPSAQGVKTIQGTTEHYMDYESMFIFLAAVFGDLNTTPTPNEITIVDRHGSGSANHYFVEIDKGHTQFRFGPGKPGKITISGEKDGRVKFSIEWYFRDVDIVTSGFTGSGYTEKDIMLFEHGVFRLADQADALAAVDEFNIDSFEIELDRNWKPDDYTTNSSDPKLPLEPIEDGFRTASLKISIPRFDANTIITWKDDDEPLQGDLKFTLGSNYTTLQLPELRISEGFDANIGGPEALTLEGTFVCYRCANASHPMGTGNEIKVLYE